MENGKCVTLGEKYAYVSTGKEKLWVPSKLKIRYDRGRPPQGIGSKHEEGDKTRFYLLRRQSYSNNE